MNPVLVVVQGEKNCGKSTSFRRLYESLLEQRVEKYAPGAGRRKQKEVLGDVFIIQKVKVGLISPGDRVGILKHWLKEIEVWNCEVIVCACHPDDGTVKYLKGLGYDIEFVEKAPVSPDQQQRANRETAEELMEAINRAVVKVKAARRAARQLAAV
jgi:hypothetical protein